MKQIIWIILSSFILLGSCRSDFGKPTPVAMGSINVINVVCDTELWNGPLGDTLRAYYQSPFPMMPSAEPYFKLRHFPADKILNNYLRRELRTYLFVGNLGDKDSPTSKFIAADLGEEKMRKAREDDSYNNSVGRNKWAEPQLLIYLFGQDSDDLAEAIRSSFPSAAQRIQKHDKSIINPTVYLSDINKGISDTIRSQFGIDIKIPGDYKMALNDGRSVWLRKIFRNKIFYNILIDKREYTSQEELQLDNLKVWRDEIGKRMVDGPSDGSYMVSTDVDLPIYQTVMDLNSNYAAHLRGLWEMEGDFMGGPYFSYAILSPNQKEIVFIDAFIFAPGEQKQKHMQYMDHIVSTVKFVGQ